MTAVPGEAAVIKPDVALTEATAAALVVQVTVPATPASRLTVATAVAVWPTWRFSACGDTVTL